MVQKIGYDDTPFIPGTNYRVHDGTRPQPKVVDPGEVSTQDVPGIPPSDAVVLFDGKDISKWESLDGSLAKWKVENSYMEVVPGKGNIRTKEHFGNCQLHVEWSAPSVIKGEGQGRGNSGVFLMGLYEIQVLDCYNNQTYPDGTTAAIYGQFPPLVNVCRRPGRWQIYDVVWIGPWFEEKKLLSPARITVFHNGIVVHHDTALLGPTTHGQLLPYKPHPVREPLMLQDHGDLVRYRNIWYRPLNDYDQP